MNCVKEIQKFLLNNEKCTCCVEGSLVTGWTRTPHLFAIVSSSVNNHGLLVFSHPGFGSNETPIRPVHAFPMDASFRFIMDKLVGNKSTSEIQLKLSSGSDSYIVELLTSESTQKFLSIITEIHNRPTTSTSFDWLNAYVQSNKQSQDDWPWSEIIKAISSSEYIPIAFDSDADIHNFDPFAQTTQVKTKNDNILKEYEDISNDVMSLNINTEVNTVASENVSSADAFDLKDFDPLSKEEIEGGIKSEKMISAELLRRSREVVSTRASAGKSWIERTLSQTLGTDKTPSNKAINDKDFDEVDNLEIQNYKTIIPSSPLLLLAGSRSSNIFKGMHVRENYIRLYMAAREKEFTEEYPFTIFVGTWNVNGRQAATESIILWSQQNYDPPDVFAFGFQELDLSAEALVFNDSSREESWLTAIENALPKTTEYYKLRHVRLVGMMLVVYVQTKHKMQVTDVEAETNGTGIMGMMGNKGGVAVRLQLHNSTICFINSHLAAHMMEYERRNQDFREVYQKLKFSMYQPPISIKEHNMIFWLGDLNYRFDELDPDQVKHLIEKADYAKLYSYDQLNRQKAAGKAFHGFSEGKLLFPPTYKFYPGTDNWDTSEKSRAPAWCDRILWKGKAIQQLAYRHHPEQKLSDHKPVSALFSVGIKVVDQTRQKKVFEEIVRTLDRKENESLPQVKLGKHEFQFDNVEFMKEKIEILPIANIGKSPVEFQFIAKLEDVEVSKPWIKINPVGGFIMPGDVAEIEIMILVDKLSAPELTVNQCKMDDILVLHLVDGKDFFVSINGIYKPSVFGSSLEALARIYEPISQVSVDSLIRLESIAAIYDGHDNLFPESIEPLEIPKELWLLIDHLHKYGMTVENILLQNGIDEEIIKIQTHLDTGQGGKMPGSIYSIGESLLLFLEALPEPVVPYEYQAKCLEACNNYVLCKQMVVSLPDTHTNVFRYLTSFLRELLKQRAENKLDAKVLAAVFGTILLRSPIKQVKDQNRRTQANVAQKKSKFVYHFLVNDFRNFTNVH